MPNRLKEMDLCVTYRCNLACSFCSEAAGDPLIEEMSTPRILSLIHEAGALGLQSIHFSGGEPTLHPDLHKMIAAAASSGIHNRIITNGYRLNREKIRRYKDAGLDAIMFSIDGLPETHNQLRGAEDSFQEALKALEIAMAENLVTRINMVIWRKNVEDLIPLLKTSITLGVDIFSAFIGCPVGRGRSLVSELLDPWEWRDILNKVKSLVHLNSQRMEIVFEKGDCWPKEEGILNMGGIQGCGAGCSRLAAPNEYLIFRSDGNAYPCVFFMGEAPPLTSVKEDSLEKALARKSGQAFYERIAQPLEECKGCEYFHPCNSGCRGLAAGVYGDFFRRDPRCAKRHVERCLFYPLCPIMKINMKSGFINGSTDNVI